MPRPHNPSDQELPRNEAGDDTSADRGSISFVQMFHDATAGRGNDDASSL